MNLQLDPADMIAEKAPAAPFAYQKKGGSALELASGLLELPNATLLALG